MTLKWKDDFYHHTGVSVSDEDIQEMIILVASPYTDVISVTRGDTTVYNMDGEIIVAKDFYIADIEE